jgi:hypothetical protein
LGVFSLEQKSKAGKIGGTIAGQIHKENGTGVCSIPIEQKRKNGRKGGKIGGKSNAKNKTGICGISLEQRIEHGRITGYKKKELNIGVCGLTTEERRENVKITNSQRWECCMTGYVSTASGVVQHQRGRGIDTSKNNRRRIE